jgi:hypothetical protein
VRTYCPVWFTTAATSPRRRPRPCPRMDPRPTHTQMCSAAAAQDDVAVTSTSETTARHHSAARRPALGRLAKAAIRPRRSRGKKTSSSASVHAHGISSIPKSKPWLLLHQIIKSRIPKLMHRLLASTFRPYFSTLPLSPSSSHARILFCTLLGSAPSINGSARIYLFVSPPLTYEKLSFVRRLHNVYSSARG